VIVETALYFPHIRVPETSWFAQILLYWDKAAAIVPYSLSTDESSVGRYMTQLARARLVEFISPDEHLGRYDEAFCANFLALVQTHALMEVPEPASLHPAPRGENELGAVRAAAPTRPCHVRTRP
jgi:hypothetical protein